MKKNLQNMKFKGFTLNFGPQHPAAHGVLRLILSLKGELIYEAEPHIGLLHRGTEKLMEYKTFLQGLPYLDRLDYVSTMSQEHCYSLLIENMLQIELPKKAQLIRVLFCELTRILNHLLAISTHALDVGAMTPFLWAFEDREKIMSFYEEVSGARIHAAYIRPGGVSQDIPKSTLNKIIPFIKSFSKHLDNMEEMLSNNTIWKQRLMNIGLVSRNNSYLYGFSGVMLRGTGCNWDLRKQNKYDYYPNLYFKIPVGFISDSFGRYYLRIIEMKESVFLIHQCCAAIPRVANLHSISNYKITKPKKKNMKRNMESTITHFKLYTQGYSIHKNENYMATEAPKGEFGVFLITDNSNKPYRIKFRAPGFYHLQGLNLMTKGHLMSDLVTIIGTQDLVFGEVDR